MRSLITVLVSIMFVISMSAQTFNFGVAKVYGYDNHPDDKITLFEIMGNAGKLNVGARIGYGQKYESYMPIGFKTSEVIRFGYVVSHRFMLFENSAWHSDIEIGGQFNMNAFHGHLEGLDFGLHYTYRKYLDTHIGLFATSRFKLWNWNRQIINSDYITTWPLSNEHFAIGIFYKFPSLEPIEKYESKSNNKPSGIIW